MTYVVFRLFMSALGSGVGTGVVVDGKVMSGTRGLVEGGHVVRRFSL